MLDSQVPEVSHPPERRAVVADSAELAGSVGKHLACPRCHASVTVREHDIRCVRIWVRLHGHDPGMDIFFRREGPLLDVAAAQLGHQATLRRVRFKGPAADAHSARVRVPRSHDPAPAVPVPRSSVSLDRLASRDAW